MAGWMDGWAKLERIKTDCIRVNLKNIARPFSRLSQLVSVITDGQKSSIKVADENYFSIIYRIQLNLLN